jgi:hypothetical protein
MPESVDEAQSVDDYRELYIAFLDLLGFKSQVEDAENDPVAHDKLRTILNLVRESLCENPSINFRLNYFSDCIVLSGERTPHGLREMFSSVCLLTSNLMQHDVLIRGGLAAGRVHHSRDFLYGSAFNRAYKLESEVAHDPMVLLSDEVVEDAKKYGPEHVGFLVEQDGRWFIHFLLQYALYRPKPICQGMVILDRPGARVINYICQRLNNHQGSIRTKAEWIRAYWNETVAVHGVFGKIEEGVAAHIDLGGPTIAIRRIYVGDPRPKT